MESYEEICERCNGRGYLLRDYVGKAIGVLCETCLGAGTIDWVQKVTGVKFSFQTIRKREENSSRLYKKGIPTYSAYPQNQEEKMSELKARYKLKQEKARELRKQRGRSKMGTRALILIDDKPMIATHWDGYPSSLGKDLLESDKSIRSIIDVAKKHSIDFADKSIRKELNKERVKFLAKKHSLTEKEIREGVRKGSIISTEDYEIADVKNYGDWAEYEYNIKGKEILFRPLSGSYPESLKEAKGFDVLTKEKAVEKD